MWRALPSGPHRVEVGEVTATIDGDGGPAALDVVGLPAGRRLPVRVDGRRAGHLTTLSPLGGPVLARVAVLSDLHLGEPHFGLLPRIGHPDPGDPPNERALRSALAQARAWGADAVVLKGDLTDRGRPEQWAMLAESVADFGIPVLATLGNHDVKPGAVSGLATLAAAGVALAADGGVVHRDLDGLRLIVADSTLPEQHHGSPEAFADEVVALASAAAGPAIVAFHHQVHALPTRLWWPPGMWGDEPRRFLDRLAAANPRTVVSTGHTHRHRRRRYGPLVMSETGSPKDGAGTWTGYVVTERDFLQVTRRVAGPAELAWSDATGAVVFGLWGRWSPGRLVDRCFVHRWG